MIRQRGPRQWFIDGPAGVGLIAIALIATVVGIKNMVISGEVHCDHQVSQTTTCTITTFHLTGHETQRIEPVESAQVFGNKTSSRENSGDQYRHRVWLVPMENQSASVMAPLPMDSKNKPSQEALAQQINQFLPSNQTHLSLTQTPGLQDYALNAFIALLIVSAGCWGCFFLIRGMD